MSDLSERILALGHLPSTHIADRLGCSSRYARRVLAGHGLAKPVGPPPGAGNSSWRGGRMVDLDGYVLLQTKPRRLSEHRVVAAKTLGRDLAGGEVVDHRDGITIHNAPENLRVFPSNAAHLRATLRKRPLWSCAGLENIGKRTDLGASLQPVDTYRLRRERGDLRLRSILRAALELGTDHPCLCGTLHWLEQSGIDPASRPSLEHAWADLLRRFEADLAR